MAARAVPETTPSWPRLRDRAREPPVRDARAHSALNDQWMRHDGSTKKILPRQNGSLRKPVRIRKVGVRHRKDKQFVS